MLMNWLMPGFPRSVTDIWMEWIWITFPSLESSIRVLALSFVCLFVFTLFCFTILYWFCHTLTWISHGCTWVPKHEPPSHLPPHIISLDHPRAPAPSILYPASNIDWQFVSYMIVYMFQCHSPKSSHPLPQSPKSVLYICVSLSFFFKQPVPFLSFSLVEPCAGRWGWYPRNNYERRGLSCPFLPSFSFLLILLVLACLV